MDNVLHIFGQRSYHEEAVIIGDEEALRKLRNSIDDAIENEMSTTQLFVNDGEGYNIYIKKYENMKEIPVPYTTEHAQEHDEGKWDSFGKIVSKMMRSLT